MGRRTILVTGGAGHVGSHVVEALVADPGNQVISLDNYFNGTAGNHVPGAEYREGHTRDIEARVPETPAIVYHLGEYSRVETSFADVQKVYDMNIVGTFAVAEFCRNRKGPKLVYAASSTRFAIEGNGRDQNPYSFSKATNVDLITNYGDWYQLPYAICYFYNAFGPREKGTGDYATLIAKYERRYLRGEPLEVVRPGSQRRRFTYVKDLARGIILAGERGSGDGYALAATSSYSVTEIADAFGGPVELIDGYAGRLDAEPPDDKARRELGWEPTLDVMEHVARFRREHPRRADP